VAVVMLVVVVEMESLQLIAKGKNHFLRRGIEPLHLGVADIQAGYQIRIVHRA